MNSSINLTPAAIDEVRTVMSSQELEPGTMLRIGILGGGCRGMQYSLGFDTVFDPKVDVQYDYGDVKLVTAKKFDLYFEGTEIDYTETPYSKGFSIENPNFPKSLGCPGCGG